MRRLILAIAILIAAPSYCFAQASQYQGFSDYLGPIHVVGGADTTSTWVVPNGKAIRGNLMYVKGPSGANDSLHLLFDYAFINSSNVSTKGKEVWRRFDSLAYVVSDTAVANWPKTFTIKVGDSLGTYKIRARGRISDDATTDSTLAGIGIGFFLNLWGF